MLNIYEMLPMGWDFSSDYKDSLISTINGLLGKKRSSSTDMSHVLQRVTQRGRFEPLFACVMGSAVYQIRHSLRRAFDYKCVTVSHSCTI